MCLMVKEAKRIRMDRMRFNLGLGIGVLAGDLQSAPISFLANGGVWWVLRDCDFTCAISCV
jgi:hypothetical protein